MNKLKLFVILMSLMAICSCNLSSVHLPDIEDDGLWMVDGNYFATLQDAMDYVYAASTKSVSTVTSDRTIYLMKDVTDGQRGGGLVVPSDFSGKLQINFNGRTYEFSDSLDHFFVIQGGDEVYITNGKTIIHNEASHEPFAVCVNTQTVHIDEHLIDDRRTDSKLFDVRENGSLVVENIAETDEGVKLNGVISVVTDGTSGGVLTIDNSRVYIDNILTRYRNSETGEIEDSIPSDVAISDAAKTNINISSGYVTINRIETLSDYYVKDEGGTTLFAKAYLNIFSKSAGDNTKVENPHDLEAEKLDTAIQSMIDDHESTLPVDHVVIHDFDAEHTHNEVEPTCTETGNIFYRQCTTCGEFFDADGNHLDKTKLNETVENGGTIIPALGHSVEHIAAKDPTCTEDGNIEHWHCTRCDKYFSDSTSEHEISYDQTIVEALGHDYEWRCDDYVHWQVCNRCGYSTKDRAEDHIWGPEHPCDDGSHMVRDCEVCGATKNATEPEFDEYQIGFGIIKVPKVENSPCGDFVVVRDGNSYTVSYYPHLNSNMHYDLSCRYQHKGVWSDYLTKVSDVNGDFKFEAPDNRDYLIYVQAFNQGGSITRTIVVNNLREIGE